MTEKTRVLVVSGYDINRADAKISRGIPVRHHMWGVNELRQSPDLEVKILEYSKLPILNRLINARWGNIDQQLRILARWDFDVLYATTYHVAMGLGMLRQAGLFRKPIVAVQFTIPPGGRVPRMCMRGFSHIICLSSLQADILSERFPDNKDRISVHCWGWDLNVPHTSEQNSNVILTAGKTLRDFKVFCQGIAGTSAQGTIVCPKRHLQLNPEDVPENCELISGDNVWSLQDDEMSEALLNSRAVAIPLDVSDTQPHGLTSLLEAMAHGRPVLMTRNPCIDIDIEALGCGIWVEPNSSASWNESIRRIVDDADLSTQMGQRGRELVETRYNIDRFADHVADAIASVC